MSRARKPLALPPDIYWPLRIWVSQRGECVPFDTMLLWHWQFFVRRVGGLA